MDALFLVDLVVRPKVGVHTIDLLAPPVNVGGQLAVTPADDRPVEEDDTYLIYGILCFGLW